MIINNNYKLIEIKKIEHLSYYILVYYNIIKYGTPK